MVGVPQLESPLRSFCCCVVDLAELTGNVDQVHFEITLENEKKCYFTTISPFYFFKSSFLKG